MDAKLIKRGHLRGLLVTGTIVAALAAAGCGASPASPAASSAPASSSGETASQQVTIIGNNALKFAPMTVHVHTGKVLITLKDMGAYPHNIVIPGLGITSKTVTGDPGGTKVSFSVTFPHPGRYVFHCQYHASSGMVGAFVVS